MIHTKTIAERQNFTDPADTIIRETDIVYLAGPMTGLPNLNRTAFNRLADLIRKHFKCKVLNPAELPDGHTYEEYMTMCFALIEEADVVVLMEGWQQSSGAKREFSEAYRLRKHIVEIMKQESEGEK